MTHERAYIRGVKVQLTPDKRNLQETEEYGST